jgi:hypothetical protein
MKFSNNTRVRIFFCCCAQREFFFQNSTLGYMTKTLNQIREMLYFFSVKFYRINQFYNCSDVVKCLFSFLFVLTIQLYLKENDTFLEILIYPVKFNRKEI